MMVTFSLIQFLCFLVGQSLVAGWACAWRTELDKRSIRFQDINCTFPHWINLHTTYVVEEETDIWIEQGFSKHGYFIFFNWLRDKNMGIRLKVTIFQKSLLLAKSKKLYYYHPFVNYISNKKKNDELYIRIKLLCV